MGKTAIGTAMLELMKEHEVEWVMWGDAHMIDWAFKRSGSKAKVRHPLQRWQIVLNALSRDSLFDQYTMKIDLYIASGYTHRHVRVFKPKAIS